jgi:Domain of unknown function (DUF5666)
MDLRHFKHALAAVAMAALAACGGAGTSTAPVAGSNQTPVVVSGAITGFGSVFVNGTRFDTSGASITQNGSPATQQALRVGQIVHIQGVMDDSTGLARAERVRQDNNLEGPITAIDAAAQTFVVLAQTVRVTAETSFDDSLGTSFAVLTVGLQVEVSGMPNAAGHIIATRIEKRGAGETALEIEGKVSALNTTTRKFNINALVVDYSAATLSDFGAAGIANDQIVEVKGSTVNAAGELIATRVERRNHEQHDRDGSFRREVEGLITRFVSATDFDVAGRKVTTTATTRYEGGTVADLALNTKVEAEGAIDANGVLVAVKIEFKRGHNAGVAGVVDAVAPGADGITGTVTVLGVTVTVDARTRVEDKGSTRIEMFRLSNLAVGDFIRVRGTETGPLQLSASRLERRRLESNNRSFVRGTARALARPNLTVLGVPVVTNASTQFEEVTADEFFATAAGRVVAAKGPETANSITAVEIEFEDHDD